MWIQNIVHEACPICGKETTLAVIEPQPIPKWSSIHIDVWIAARSKPRPFGYGRVDCRERHRGLPLLSRPTLRRSNPRHGPGSDDARCPQVLRRQF
jgi:hypothetical protein